MDKQAKKIEDLEKKIEAAHNSLKRAESRRRISKNRSRIASTSEIKARARISQLYRDIQVARYSSL